MITYCCRQKDPVAVKKSLVSANKRRAVLFWRFFSFDLPTQATYNLRQKAFLLFAE